MAVCSSGILLDLGEVVLIVKLTTFNRLIWVGLVCDFDREGYQIFLARFGRMPVNAWISPRGSSNIVIVCVE